MYQCSKSDIYSENLVIPETSIMGCDVESAAVYQAGSVAPPQYHIYTPDSPADGTTNTTSYSMLASSMEKVQLLENSIDIDMCSVPKPPISEVKLKPIQIPTVYCMFGLETNDMISLSKARGSSWP